MPKFLIELYLDGYDTEDEMIEACKEFIEEQLDFSASSVKVLEVIKDEENKDLFPYLDGKNL